MSAAQRSNERKAQTKSTGKGDAAKDRLFLIDGTALAYRSYHAITRGGTVSMTNRAGHPTSATFAFSTSLDALLRQEQPEHIAVSFDGPTSELERTKFYPEYKATRESAPEEFLAQLSDIEAVVAAYGIRSSSSPGHEADDVIATLAVAAKKQGMQVYIVTGDKDFMQIVDDDIKLWDLRSSTAAPDIIGPDEVVAKWGVEATQVADFLALMGDSSDNVPGVPKVGKKTAADLLQEFGDLDTILARAEEVKKPSIRKTLLENRDLALLSRDLVTIRLDVPLDCGLDEIGPPAPDESALRELFKEFEFNTLLKGLAPKPTIDLEHTYTMVRDEASLQALIERLRKAGSFAFDTETTSLDSMQADLVGVSFSDVDGEAFYVPFNLDPPVLAGGPAALVEAIRPLLEDSNVKKTIQNAKYDLGVLRRAGIEMQGLDFDTMLASYCVGAGVQAHGLDALSLQYFDKRKIPTKQLLGVGKKQKTFNDVDIDAASEYACEDAEFTWRLRSKLAAEMDEAKVRPVLDDIELPLVPVLLDMEWEGIRVDVDHLNALSAKLTTRSQQIEERIFERSDEPFNLNSPAQIGVVLFDQLEVHKAAGVRPKKTPKGQWKTDAAMLEKLAAHHEVPQMLLEYRQLVKLNGTYVEALPKMVNPDTGRIHTSFNQAVAATGRLSSDNPNLQNIPIRTEEGREVRKAFVARDKGWQLLSADYSQIELRILAHFSKDKALVESFRKREDIHQRTAALVHGMIPAMVSPELRNQAKAINYGLMYGMGASRLASETGMRPPEAKKFIERYFQALPGVKGFLDATLAKAQEDGEVRTLDGRRRRLPEIDSTNAMQRITSQNMAVNTPIQGTAADIIKRAMLSVHARLKEGGFQARMLLQVHDELVLDVPDAEIDAVGVLVKESMEGAADLIVPLEVAMGHGRTWLDAH